MNGEQVIMSSFSLALGTATKNRDGKIIEAFFPTPTLHPSEQLVKDIAAIVGYRGGNQAIDVTPEQCAAIASAFEDEIGRASCRERV